jgi:hypothetical protein
MTEKADARATFLCPHPSCRAEIKVKHTVPAGVYPCRCDACKLRLTWATYIGRGRVPFAELVEKEAQ